ncbi:MAG: flagellar FliJ family protein [Alphaproteobacteria bacterium]|nr:flagellar FliJ family protein [Alphaproteobacteria bacterium]
MADLNPLIRVRRHSVEQKQKFLAELYRQAEELDNNKASLLRQLAEEREKMADMGAEMISYFGPYAEAVRGRVKDIEEDRAKLEKRIERAREDMREAFADLKKIEITQERREDEAGRAQDKKESNMLDDIGVEAFRRRRQEEEG